MTDAPTQYDAVALQGSIEGSWRLEEVGVARVSDWTIRRNFQGFSGMTGSGQGMPSCDQVDNDNCGWYQEELKLQDLFEKAS